jgi:hypothetical protein
MSLIGAPPKSVSRTSVVRSSRGGSARRRPANSMAYMAMSMTPLLSASPAISASWPEFWRSAIP